MSDVNDETSVEIMIPNQIRAPVPERATAYRAGGVLANRTTLSEGPRALDAERLGRASEALHMALLQSNPPGPGEDPVIRLFRGVAARVEGAIQAAGARRFRDQFGDRVRAGAICVDRIAGRRGGPDANPWGAREVAPHRDGRRSETIRGSLLRFATRQGEKIAIEAL